MEIESKRITAEGREKGRRGDYLKRKEEVKPRMVESRCESQEGVGEMVVHNGTLEGLSNS